MQWGSFGFWNRNHQKSNTKWNGFHNLNDKKVGVRAREEEGGTSRLLNCKSLLEYVLHVVLGSFSLSFDFLYDNSFSSSQSLAQTMCYKRSLPRSSIRHSDRAACQSFCTCAMCLDVRANTKYVCRKQYFILMGEQENEMRIHRGHSSADKQRWFVRSFVAMRSTLLTAGIARTHTHGSGLAQWEWRRAKKMGRCEKIKWCIKTVLWQR